MLFPVTIYNSKGEVKKIVSKEVLHQRHWEVFQVNDKSFTFQAGGVPRISKELKEKLDMDFPESSRGNHN